MTSATIMRRQFFRLHLADHVGLGFCFILWAQFASTAFAATVTVTGGFTGYSGLVGCGQFVTFINGQNVTGTTGCDSTTLTAPLTTSFASTPNVLFDYEQLGSGATPNIVGFEPADLQNVAGVGTRFLLGTLTFANGSWFGTGNDAAEFHLMLTTSSSDSRLNGSVFDGTLELNITPNDFVNNTPLQNADSFDFKGFTNLGEILVYELNDSPTGRNTGSVDLYGEIDDLAPTDFANPQGAALLAPGTASQTPEPGTAALEGLGLAALFAIAARHRNPGQPQDQGC